LVYAHLNLLIRDNDLDMIFCVGPGHGAPGILASLWLEGSLGKFYPEYSRDRTGLHNLISKFSTPTGLPRLVNTPNSDVVIAEPSESHINAGTPGSIHEGGELGYLLLVAFGAVMDKPNLIACAIIGDGEAETGPTATYGVFDVRLCCAALTTTHAVRGTLTNTSIPKNPVQFSQSCM
jgi:xylulose-5-phosphate/fructose-6-phosphate phosphoketolase